MNYKELHELIDEFGLKKEGYKLLFKNYTVAYINNNFIDKKREIAYCLDFSSSYISTVNYDVAKKATVKRVATIKNIIIHNRKVELENDFQ